MGEWDGENLALTFREGPNYGAFRDVRLLNLDENPATLEMIVGYYYAYEEENAQAYIELTHVRPIDMIYQWQGETLTLQCRHFADEPTTFFETLHSADDPKIEYFTERLDDETIIKYGFYDYSGHRYSSDPDNIFDVPDDIDGMVKIPICL